MTLRNSNIERLKQQTFDVLIIGGGINGAVSAAALSGRGVKVALIDKRDFAGFTSQHSSNLAWGGIKYMETYEFGLVRNLCKSRNHLIRNYPSTVQEIRFLATIEKGFRWHPLFLWLGAWLYWVIGSFFTKTPRYLSSRKINREEPIINTAHAIGGFEYSDAYLHDNDSRFVFGFIRAALDHGCIATNYVESLGGIRDDGLWAVQARDTRTGERFTIHARALINAAGPFADQHNQLTDQSTHHRHVFSKGIHIIVNRLTPHRRVLAFFGDDGRLFFVIPMGVRTCIGTTDTRVDNPTTHVTEEDRDFVLNNINKRLQLADPITHDDIISERCGVRPLVVTGDSGKGSTDWMQLSRKHAVEAHNDTAHITIFGGKLTDCLNVGEEVCELIESFGLDIPFPTYRWYGEPSDDERDRFFHEARLMSLDDHTAPTSSEALSTRLWRRYGRRAFEILERIRQDPRQADLLIKNTEYIRAEIEQAASREMIVTLEDFLRRRSKISMVLSTEDIYLADGLMEACRLLFGPHAQARFDEYFEEHAHHADPDAPTINVLANTTPQHEALPG